LVSSPQPLIGYFINTTAVRTLLEADDTFAALAKRVSTGVLAALDRNLLPFSEVRVACLAMAPVMAAALALLRSACHTRAWWHALPSWWHALPSRQHAFTLRAGPFCLVQVVSAVGAPRSPGVNPIFQVRRQRAMRAVPACIS
jgi:hypothetical protein